MIEDHEKWAAALNAVIDEYLAKQKGEHPRRIPAAPLKPLLIRHVSVQDLALPLAELETRKFVDFLELFPETVKVTRRLGQDALVTKASEGRASSPPSEEAIIVEPTNEISVLRPDVFKAFTVFASRDGKRWYDAETDQFVDSPERESEAWRPVPMPSLAEAISDREEFARGLAEDQRDHLLRTLEGSQSPLPLFTAQVKRLGLGRTWHTFRLGRLLQRAKSWARSAEIPWNTAWERPRSQATRSGGPRVTPAEMNALVARLMRLGPNDASRVMVPLDVVLKLMRSG